MLIIFVYSKLFKYDKMEQLSQGQLKHETSIKSSSCNLLLRHL
jgi:hypothetical protein